MALAGLATMTAGMVLRLPAVVAWGGAVIAGIAVARAGAKLSVMRLRAAGLEMIWQTGERIRKVTRGGTIPIVVELRNRDERPVRYDALRPIASRELDVKLEPAEGTIPAGASASLRLEVRAPRVGRHCIHGLAVEVRGPRGLFEVPLAFANPVGIEVLPPRLLAMLTSARGGRSRRASEAGSPKRRPGAGTEIYELREHVSGDPFKRIAWKASARRGKLLVRELEREDRDVVWLVLDAAVELWAGPLGQAPLDHGVDELASIASRHLARGDRVGLAVAGVAQERWLAPADGAAHALRLADLLIASASMLDADRSDYDELDVARRVLDHLRFLDSSGATALREEQLETIQTCAEAQRSRAPFDLPAPWAKTAREQSLRRYLACYGISSPPRVDDDKGRAVGRLVQALERAATDKPRPSLVYVWSAAPEAPSVALAQTVNKLVRRGVGIRWTTARHEGSLEGDDAFARVIADAVAVRAKIARERGERILRAMGVRLARGTRSGLL